VNLERLRKTPNISIIGSTSPLGKELREILDSSSFPVGKLSLLETEEYAGLLQEFAGEIRITQIISPEHFADVDIAFFACSPEIINAYAASGSPFPDLTIDLTQTRTDGQLFLSGVSSPSLLTNAAYIINPHPAAIAITRVLSRLRSAFRIEAASITILQPASERGSSGVDELQEQTVSLLYFQHVESRFFVGQLAFNLLPETETSARTEQLVRAQVGTLLDDAPPFAGLTIVQAPVFHSHAFSMFVKLDECPAIEKVSACLRDSHGAITDEDPAASPVTVVGSEAIRLGRVGADTSQKGWYSLWFVADNLRIAAHNAIQIAESIMLAPAPR
jgi:aspartate-semialdehyde dehydrogenase